MFAVISRLEWKSQTIQRSSHRRCSVKKGVFKNLRPATLLQKRLWHRCFPVNFAKCLRPPILRNTKVRNVLKVIYEEKSNFGYENYFPLNYVKLFLIHPEITTLVIPSWNDVNTVKSYMKEMLQITFTFKIISSDYGPI